MKQLEKLIAKVSVISVIGDMSRLIADISFNTKTIHHLDVFVAVKGTNFDAHLLIPEAIAKGAVAVICERIPETLQDGVTYVLVNNSAEALGIMAATYFDNPSDKLKLTGVTGTNGKTTIATLLYQLMFSLGYKTGLISTIENKINGKIVPSTHTTPDPVALNKLLKDMVDNGCVYAFMEVSSHAIIQQRIAGLTFTGGIFTNITHDHLDYHKTFANYIKAKKMFFDNLPSSAFALTNLDDKNGDVMLQNTKAKKYTYGLQSMADFKCKVLENNINGSLLHFSGHDVWCRLVGNFNAYNLTAIYATAILLGESQPEILALLSNLKAAEGRFECMVDKNKITAIVDYAHTPDALKNVLSTIKELTKGGGNIITVIGAGGDRDKTKRPEMAEIAASFSEKVILTADNPRSENPEIIINEMEAGVSAANRKNVLSITDRKQAIKTAYALAKANDIILIAGKGHEKYQEINGVKYPFDDKKIIKELMEI